MADEQSEQRTAEAERIEQLAEELYEVERLQRRLDGLHDRLRAYVEERETLATELADKRRGLGRVRRRVLGLWLALRGTRPRRLQEEEMALARVERRHHARSQLVASLEAELAHAQTQVQAHRPAAELRAALDSALQKQRARLDQEAPELALRLCALEEELPQARAARTAAARALANVREISRLLESARTRIHSAINRGVFEALVLDSILITHSKYMLLNEATASLRAARVLMDELRVLDPVRDDLTPLEPSIGQPLRIADYLLDSFLVDLTVIVRSEDSLDGVEEAQKLFADLEPMLEQAARLAQHHADNLERLWCATLVDAASANGAGEHPEHTA